MEYEKIINKAVSEAKNGSVEGFENFYILTYQEMYRMIVRTGYGKNHGEELMEMVYISAYGKIQEAPDKHIEEWMRELLYGLGEEENEETELQSIEEVIPLSEEKAATILLKIEEHLGIIPKEEPEKLYERELKESEGGRKSFFRIIISAVLSIVIIAAICLGLWKKEHRDERESQTGSSQENSSVEEIHKEKEQEEISQITIHLADQIFVLDGEGNIISTERGKKEYHSSVQDYKGYTYYLPRENGLKNTLMRVYEKDREEYEVIDENVDDYVLMDGIIYYVKDGIIKQKETGIRFGKKKLRYSLVLKDDEFVIINELGESPENGNSDFLQNGIVYYLENGCVTDSEAAECIYNDICYTLEDKDGDGKKEICWVSDEDEGILVKEGFGIDSFCLADGWIYYSAFEEIDPEDMHYSRIYRIKPDGSVQELIKDTFQGNINNMYYSNEKRKIYGEFMPDASHSLYGNLVAITFNGWMKVLDDSTERNRYQTGGNDMLKFLGSEDENIYCFLYDYQWTRGENPVVLWKKPLILKD